MLKRKRATVRSSKNLDGGSDHNYRSLRSVTIDPGIVGLVQSRKLAPAHTDQKTQTMQTSDAVSQQSVQRNQQVLQNQ